MQIDFNYFLKTIGSLTAAAWFITELIGRYLKKLRPYKQLLAILLTVAIGMAARYSGLAFSEIPVVQFALALVIAAAGAQVVNDKIAKPLGLQLHRKS